METLKTNYESACNAYLKAFCSKHEFEYNADSWVNGDIGGITDVADYCIDMSTIRYDIDNDCPEESFAEWCDYSMRMASLDVKYPNFENWIRKCPIKTEAEILEMEALAARIDELKSELTKLCEK